MRLSSGKGFAAAAGRAQSARGLVAQASMSACFYENRSRERRVTTLTLRKTRVGLFSRGFVSIVLATAMYQPWAMGQSPMNVTAYRDQETGDVVMANDLIRLHFHHGRPRFGTFPDGYTGYTLEAKDGDKWLSAASAPCFTAGAYATYWGRDFLDYALPKECVIDKHPDAATATFTQDLELGDWVAWRLTFSFTLTAQRPVVDVVYQAEVLRGRELLLFWGPRIHVGEGSFGADKDEALFPGLEHLQGQEQSSDIWSLAPDLKLNYAPHPAKITIPLMAVRKGHFVVGMMWNPNQKWYKDMTCPTAVFASPNWIERKENHLMGLFVPTIPDNVAENSLRAYRPVTIEEGGLITISAKLFAAFAADVVDAIDLYLAEYGGLPEVAPRPMDDRAALELLVRGLVDCWSPEARGWPWTIAAPPIPHAKTLSTLLNAKPLLNDAALSRKVEEMTAAALKKQPILDLDLALRLGGVEKILDDWTLRAGRMVQEQHVDGSWGASPGPIGEEGLAVWNAPPDPGYIGLEGERSQGITAAALAWLTSYVLITHDAGVFRACVHGFEDLDQYIVPYCFYSEECPRAVSLHGSQAGLRACLNAYRVTNDRKWLDKAVFWAKSGMQFIYLWSLPPRETKTGHIHSNNPALLAGSDLYTDTVRAPMLYASLYGYGSSQFQHHWFGLPVQWIGLAFADDIWDLARHDQSLDWLRVADGLCNSCLWMTFDKAPYMGFYPDAFSLITWAPSGPAITPANLLRTFLRCKYDMDDERTVIVREEDRSFHLTAAARIGDEAVRDGVLSFTLDDPGWTHCRAIVTDLPEDALICVDDSELARVQALEESEEGWVRSANKLVILKVRQGSAPRRVTIKL